MKKSIYLLLIVFSGLLFSCEKQTSTEDTSKITHFVTFELDGPSVVTVPIGESYVEPGYTAYEGENDVTPNVVVTDDIDETSLGVYTVTYSADNVDGFGAEVERTVVFYDPNAPTTDISGSFSTTIVRTESDGINPRNYAGAVNISNIAPGIFYVDCLLGGTYSIDAGYGPAYAMTGYVALNNDNTLSLLSSYLSGWEDGLEGFQNGVYDEGTGLCYWESIYADGDIYAVTCN